MHYLALGVEVEKPLTPEAYELNGMNSLRFRVKPPIFVFFNDGTTPEYPAQAIRERFHIAGNYIKTPLFVHKLLFSAGDY